MEPTIIPVVDNLLERVMEETEGNGADVVITACSAASAQQIALTLAALDGRVNFFGGLPKGKEQVELDTNIIHYKQLSVTGTTRASHDHYRKTLHFIASGLVDVDPLVTHTFSIHDIHKAFENAATCVGLKQAIVF
jgi:L-iditol 2-dehydrogenase